MPRGNIVASLYDLIDKFSKNNPGASTTTIMSNAETWLTELRTQWAGKMNGEQKVQLATDKFQCIEALCSDESGCSTALEVKRKLEGMFPPDYKLNAEDMVMLSTVHGVKGGEATTVYLYAPGKPEGDCEDSSERKGKPNLWDQLWSGTEDRNNVLYVAITRAKEELVYVGAMPTMKPF
jgi:hypothetical protein